MGLRRWCFIRCLLEPAHTLRQAEEEIPRGCRGSGAGVSYPSPANRRVARYRPGTRPFPCVPPDHLRCGYQRLETRHPPEAWRCLVLSPAFSSERRQCRENRRCRRGAARTARRPRVGARVVRKGARPLGSHLPCQGNAVQFEAAPTVNRRFHPRIPATRIWAAGNRDVRGCRGRRPPPAQALPTPAHRGSHPHARRHPMRRRRKCSRYSPRSPIRISASISPTFLRKKQTRHVVFSIPLADFLSRLLWRACC